MLKIACIKKWMENLNVADYYYLGNVEDNQIHSLAIYQQKNETSSRTCIGKPKNATKLKQVSILVYWSNSYEETEEKALEIYELVREMDMLNLSNLLMAEVKYISLVDNEPVDIGRDNSGIYQREINIDIFYEERMN